MANNREETTTTTNDREGKRGQNDDNHRGKTTMEWGQQEMVRDRQGDGDEGSPMVNDNHQHPQLPP
jgi:hypothetical protein